MANAFSSRAGCPVPEIPAIEGSLVSSCDINPPPDTQFCFPLDVPINPPPSFNFGCYKFKANSTVNADDGCVLIASLSYVIRSGNGVPDRLPGNWLDILGSDFISSALAGCGGEASADLSVDYPNEATTGYCEPEFNFSISIPCEPKVSFNEGNIKREGPARLWLTGGRKTIITMGSSGSSGEPGGGFSATQPCEYIFKPNLNIPCSVFVEADPPSELLMNSVPSVNMEIIPIAPPEGEEDSCYYAYSVDIGVPCPEVLAETYLDEYDVTTPYFVVNRQVVNDTTGCSTILEISLGLGITTSTCLLCDVSVSATSGSGGFDVIVYRKFRQLVFTKGVLTDAGICDFDACIP